MRSASVRRRIALSHGWGRSWDGEANHVCLAAADEGNPIKFGTQSKSLTALTTVFGIIGWSNRREAREKRSVGNQMAKLGKPSIWLDQRVASEFTGTPAQAIDCLGQ